MKPFCRTPVRQSGAAFTESLVLMLAMVPLTYAVVVVGNAADWRQRATVAARYLAWEQTVGTEMEASTSSVQRFLGINEPSDSMAPGSAGAREEGKSRQQRSVLASGDGMEQLSSVQLYAGQSGASVSVSPLGMSATGVSGGVPAAVSSLVAWTDHPDTAPDSLMQATLSVEMARNPWLIPFASSCPEASGNPACLSESSSVFVDDWSAAGDAMAVERIRSMVPATILEPLGATLSVVGRLPLFGELEPLDTAFGHIDMSVLPERVNALRDTARGLAP